MTSLASPTGRSLDFLRPDRPGGAHVRELIALGTPSGAGAPHPEQRHHREPQPLHRRVDGEGRAGRRGARAERRGSSPGAPRPRPKAIPEDLKGLKTREIAARLELRSSRRDITGGQPAPATSCRSATPVGPICPGSSTNPVSGKSRKRIEFARPPSVLVKPSLFPPDELKAQVQKGLAARDAITGVPESKTGARSVDVEQKLSGYDDMALVTRVREVSAKIGHEAKVNPHLDKAGHPGSYNLCHAEKKVAVLTEEPIGVSRPMCLDCQFFFYRLAQHRGKPVVVADPTGVRVFMPDGAVISGENAAALVAAQAAGNVDIEEVLEE